jgi:thioredoxin reductase
MLATRISHICSTITKYHVVIVGAGPYGLSIAAHLSRRDMDVAVFGKPLQLWREHMPKGMLLRSHWWASSLSDPYKQYSIESYLKETGQPAIDPFPVEAFINYGLHFQKYMVPQVDETYVSCIERTGEYFSLTLADGRIIYSQTVILAIGQRYYVYKPTEYTHLPPPLITHTSDHHEFEQFAGKDVMIIGSGQGALETAALAHESGVHVHLVTRRPLAWTEVEPEEHSPLERVLHPKGGINSDWISWGLEKFPYAFYRLPKPTKARITQRIYGPIGAYWLKSRILGKVAIHESQQVEYVKEVDNYIELQLSNHKKLKVDHIILATGYRVDVRKLPMLHSSLLPAIQTYCGAPILNNYFESSVPGLYFVGFPSAMSFGPLYRFIVGTDAAAKRITSAIVQKTAHVKMRIK